MKSPTWTSWLTFNNVLRQNRMLNRPTLSIRHHTSRRLQMYRIVKFVIRRLFNAFKAYHKSPLNIASDARTKALSGRNAQSVQKLPVINRNVDNNVNSHGVSNFRRSLVSEPEIAEIENECRCQGFIPFFDEPTCIIIENCQRVPALSSQYLWSLVQLLITKCGNGSIKGFPSVWQALKH